MSKRRRGIDAELNAIAHSIKEGVRNFRALNQRGDHSQVMTWIIDGKLACAARPLRYHQIYGGSGKALPLEAKPDLDRWIERVRSEGIVSIITFVSEKELGHYRRLLPDGVTLVDYYRGRGFKVDHIPWSDPAHTGYANFDAEILNKRPSLLAAYQQFPKPVLVHCSAAIDRSPPVLAYVVYELRKNGATN